jgi:C1A family cysteine protease
MAKPEWNKRQHPEERSPEHGKRDHEHGPHEHGLGAERDPEHEHGPKQKDTDLSIEEPEEGEPLAGVTYSAMLNIHNVPPVTDQDGTPQCVAYAGAYDQNQHDRPETGRFWNFNEPLFFKEIGGTSAGAYLSKALIRRRDYGYPEQDSTPNRGLHRIAGFTQIALTVTAVKAALSLDHGVLFIGDWFHSWYHPLSTGKLPAPDYKVGGHNWWAFGWNDAYGIRAQNTWGTDYGVNGRFFLPYAFLSRMYSAYRTTDK